MKILHNNRCSKSRSALQILEEKKIDFEVVNYLVTPLSAEEIKDVLAKLNLPAKAIIRTGEAIFKENFKGKELTEDEWIAAMVEFPKLIERPIIIDGDRAVIGRPPEKVLELLG